MKKIFSTRTSENALSFSLLILRVGAGLLMLLNHGLDKIMHFAQKSPKFADPFHIGPTTSLSLLVFAEFFCAAFIILGLFTRLAAIPLIIAMGVAFFIINNGNYRGGPGGGELALLFLFIFLVILVAGPGKWSLDRFIAK
ncbi:MAG: DoxX family protein [Flavisolibacter sp.]|jgi:putative oxidoreductase|nr:DoxX family protein [Flavisolibacter sp.]